MASIVVVEPWYGGSHRVWADGWRAHSRHHIELLTLPDRNWRWRLRAGAVAAAEQFGALVRSAGRPDMVVVSSLLDAAAFAGLARRDLGDTPVALYMHENQLLYPSAPGRSRDDSVALVNWKSMLAADALWWNSDFHRRAFLEALPGLLARQPEPATKRTLDDLDAVSRTLWPGVDVGPLVEGARPVNEPPVVLWNQRWDHDKKPRAVFAALVAAARDGHDFSLLLAGENQGRADTASWVREQLGDRIVHEGWLEPDAYRDALLGSDLVVSAADHEFFGIAIVEAIAAGAVPVLPDRLSFPELIDARWHDAVLYPEGGLRPRVAEVLGDVEAARARVGGLRASMDRFDVVVAASAHDDAVDDVLAGGERPRSISP